MWYPAEVLFELYQRQPLFPKPLARLHEGFRRLYGAGSGSTSAYTWEAIRSAQVPTGHYRCRRPAPRLSGEGCRPVSVFSSLMHDKL